MKVVMSCKPCSVCEDIEGPSVLRNGHRQEGTRLNLSLLQGRLKNEHDVDGH